jgi:asparagine synthetase B (glutamine-hydrolysing)
MQVSAQKPLVADWVATFDGRSCRFPMPDSETLCASAGDITALVDGILWNREDLQRRLALPPDAPAAAILAHAWQCWGERLLGEIKGMFAIMVWDPRNNTLFCARDPMGIYPLFYAEETAEFCFSTSIDVLLRHVSPALNRAALADHLIQRWPDLTETYHSCVKRLAPGHALLLTPAGRRDYRYWDPAPPGQPIDWVREGELGRFDELLVQAVRRSLSFGPVGIFLSGGLDSVSVAAVAADQSASMGLPPPLALSLVFPHPDCDESHVQRSVAARLGLAQEVVSFDAAVGTRGWLAEALDLASRLPAPLLNCWSPAYLGLAAGSRRRECKGILTGTGGDEWLGVTPALASDLMLSGDLAGLYRLWRAQRRSFRLPLIAHARLFFWNFALRPLLGDLSLHAPGGTRLHAAARSVRRWLRPEFPGWLAPDPDLRRRLVERRLAAELQSRRESCRFDSYCARDVHCSLEFPTGSWELEEHFLFGREAGQRMLHPYLDADLVHFLYRIPPQTLNRGGRSKGLVRDYLTRAFPKLGFERQKKVIATSFFNDRFLTEARESTGWFWRKSALAELGIVDVKRLKPMVESVLARRGKQHTRQIFLAWSLFNLEAWTRRRL